MNGDPLTGHLLAILTTILAAGLLAMLGLAIIFRWEIVPPTPNPISGAATAARFDHWNDEMFQCDVSVSKLATPNSGTGVECTK